NGVARGTPPAALGPSGLEWQPRQSPAMASWRPRGTSSRSSSADKGRSTPSATLDTRNRPKETASHNSTNTTRTSPRPRCERDDLFTGRASSVNHAARRGQGDVLDGLVIAHIARAAADVRVQRGFDGSLQAVPRHGLALEFLDEHRGARHETRRAIAALE